MGLIVIPQNQRDFLNWLTGLDPAHHAQGHVKAPPIIVTEKESKFRGTLSMITNNMID